MARQLSKRGGDIGCEVQSDRVILSGRAVVFLEGEIAIPSGRRRFYSSPSSRHSSDSSSRNSGFKNLI
jgi:hypothetical protein